mgnify:CR=1
MNKTKANSVGEALVICSRQLLYEQEGNTSLIEFETKARNHAIVGDASLSVSISGWISKR